MASGAGKSDSKESLWDYAVRTLAGIDNPHDRRIAASEWQRNVAFDQFKLLTAAATKRQFASTQLEGK